MEERIVSTRTGKDDVGKTLLSFLSGRFRYHGEDGWRRLVAEGLIGVNGEVATQDRALAEGDLVSYDTSGLPEPAVDAKFAILHEDADHLVIEKSGDLPVHPSGPFFKNTLWWLLRQERQSVHIMTRLDRESSGIVVVAKNPSAAAKFAKANAAGLVRKKYIAIVSGSFPEGAFLASGTLSRREDSAVRKKLFFEGGMLPLADIGEERTGEKKDSAGAVEAKTIFRRLSSADGISAVEAELLTGRTHQIRATLNSLSYPLVGDKLYGVDDSLYLKFAGGGLDERDYRRLGARRQMLHSHEISFPSSDGSRIELVSKPPEDMLGLLDRLDLSSIGGKIWSLPPRSFHLS